MTTAGAGGQNGPRTIESVIGHIEENIAADLTLRVLARVAGITPHHFSFLFTKATGLSPHQFVLWERIERSKVYLYDTTLNVKAVSSLSGFRTQEHFTKVFRRLVGITPTHFRQHLSEERHAG